MENIGAEKVQFKIVLDKEWQQGSVQYVMGLDPYEADGGDSYGALYNVKSDGTIEMIKIYERSVNT